MDCLRCERPMDKNIEYGIVIDSCPTCRGVWLDAGELKMLEEGKVKPQYQLLKEIHAEHKDYQGQMLSVVGFCPKCQGAPMQLINYRGVELDYCPSCKGLYFDMGELEEVLRRKPTPIN